MFKIIIRRKCVLLTGYLHKQSFDYSGREKHYCKKCKKIYGYTLDKPQNKNLTLQLHKSADWVVNTGSVKITEWEICYTFFSLYYFYVIFFRKAQNCV